MPNKYVAVHQTNAGSNLPIINLTGGTAVRIYLCHLILGSDVTPADVAGEFIVSLTDTVGTGGASVVASKLDPIGAAAVASPTGGTYSTTNPTLTTNGTRLMIGLNQRATFTWWAREGFEIVSAATANNGVATQCVAMSSGTPTMNNTLMWYE